MNKTLTLGTLSLATAALLVGCGSTSSNNTEENLNQNTQTLTGYFIDSAVQNVDYKTTSGLSGKTDKFGRFQYKATDKVKLYIGKLLLGEVSPANDGLVTPKTLTSSPEKESLLLRTLQTLDADNNASNGITIPLSVIQNLESIAETSLSEHDEASLINIINELDSDYDDKIDVDEDDAKKHFDESKTDWDDGKKPDDGHEEDTKNEEHSQGDNNSSEETHGKEFDLSAYPKSDLTSDLKDTLSYMGNEERLAYDIYQNLYAHHKSENAEEIKQMKNISEKSEVKHIAIVQELVKRYSLKDSDFTNITTGLDLGDKEISDMPKGTYDVASIQELYDTLYAKGIVSSEEALKVGCMVEVTDVADLDKYIKVAEDANASDIVAAFDVLRKGSYNHYWAFDKALKKKGIENGCFVEGDTLLTNKEGLYPKNENDSKANKGREGK